MDVIAAQGLTKRYGDLAAVDGVDLGVRAGEFFGVLGPNGAGKTTLLELIEGIREPDEGHATILGLPTWPRNTSLLSRLGVQLQASAFFERLTVREQLRVFADLYGIAASHLDEVLQMVGLTPQAKTRTEDLSGGQKQRLAIGLALINSPEVVFLDEPTAALDPQARRNLWDLLRRINDDGTTVVLTTHHMDEAEALCDRVAIMDHGRILALDTPQALIDGLNAPTRICLQAGQISAGQAQALPAVQECRTGEGVHTLITLDPGATLLGLAGHDALQGLRVTGANLEDVFLALTGREYRA